MSYNIILPDRTNTDYAVLSQHPSDLGILDFEFDEGEELASRFPADAAYPMDDGFPDQRTLYDLQPNTLGLLVMSGRAVETIQGAGVTGLEFLDIRIHDHRGNPAGEDYAIVHPIGFVDCMDEEESVYEEDPLDDEVLGSVTKLSLDAARTTEGAALFRVARLPQLYVATGALSAALEDAELSGIQLLPVGEYDSALF